MTHSTQPGEIHELLESATAQGILSPGASSLLTGHLGPMVIAGAAGAALEDIVATDVTLVTLLIDASSSIAHRNLERAVREGQHALLDAFAKCREVDSILTALWTFNDRQKVVHAYVPVKDATRLDAKTYAATGCTILYDTWCDALASNVAYAQRLRDSGTPVRSVVVVVTDGEDTGSRRTAAECARLSQDLLASEQFMLAFVGVGSDADFRQVARAMGVPDGSIAVQKAATPESLRRIFQLVSQSAIRASQGLIKPGAQAGFFGP